MLNVHSIFRTISGEVNHQHQGRMATFIRLQGCNLRCKWCDTKQAQSLKAKSRMSIVDVLTQVKLLKCRNIVITGGEPLLQLEYVRTLLNMLARWNYMVTVETNGSQAIPAALQNLAYWVVDYKLQSSRVGAYMNDLAFINLKRSDIIKFVVQDETDFSQSLKVKARLIHLNPKLSTATFAYSPILDKVGVPTLMRWLEETGQFDALVSVQIHKLFQIP